MPQTVLQPVTQTRYVPVTTYQAVQSTAYVPTTVYRTVTRTCTCTIDGVVQQVPCGTGFTGYTGAGLHAPIYNRPGLFTSRAW